MRHSPHQLISGRGAPRTMVPHATVRGHRAPRRTGPISTEAYCSHSVYRSHIHLGNGMFLSSAWRAILFTLELCALGDDAGLEIAPERDQQLAGNCNDGDALNAAEQLSGIDSIGLGSPRATIDLQARRIDHVVAHAPAFEQSVQPEAIIPRFVAGDHFNGLLQFLPNSRPGPLDQL